MSGMPGLDAVRQFQEAPRPAVLPFTWGVPTKPEAMRSQTDFLSLAYPDSATTSAPTQGEFPF